MRDWNSFFSEREFWIGKKIHKSRVCIESEQRVRLEVNLNSSRPIECAIRGNFTWRVCFLCSSNGVQNSRKSCWTRAFSVLLLFNLRNNCVICYRLSACVSYGGHFTGSTQLIQPNFDKLLVTYITSLTQRNRVIWFPLILNTTF